MGQIGQLASMANGGSLKITLDADARPAKDALAEMRDRVVIAATALESECDRAYARLYRRAHLNAVEHFEALAASRFRLNPARLSDRWHARASRRWAAILEAQGLDPKGSPSTPPREGRSDDVR
jgi:hypothetical protein